MKGKRIFDNGEIRLVDFRANLTRSWLMIFQRIVPEKEAG
jgi:hypothetical protein